MKKKAFIIAIITCLNASHLIFASDNWKDNILWDVDINELSTIPDIRNIKSYNYSNKNYTEKTCPVYTWYSENLSRLDLSHNNFTTLPRLVGNLTSLQYLYLNDNKVTCLPEDIAECISLKLLDLSHNPKLDALPFCIADLPITYLNLTGTSVTVLPEEMEYRVKASMLRLEGFTGKFIIPNLLSLKGNFCGIN